MEPKTYFFVDKSEYESLKKEVQQLKSLPLTEETPSKTPLWICVAVMFVATLGVMFAINDAKAALGFYVACIVIAQCCIDYYKGKDRALWSALFRLTALVFWFIGQMVKF